MALPPHGTTSRYDNHQCRCQPCTTAKCTYSKKRRYLQDTGRWNPWANAARTRAALIRYKAAGIGVSRVCDIAGIDRETGRRILSGEYPRILRVTEQRILTADVTPARSAKMPAHGARRRVHALMWMGYTQTVLCRLTGISRSAMARLAAGAPLTVWWAVEAVARVYDELSMVPAPVSQSSKVARTHARKMGYLPPLAWDDALIDLPEEELEAECARQVSEWSNADLAAAYRAYSKEGDRSPLMVAGMSEYRRRRRVRESAQAQAA